MLDETVTRITLRCERDASVSNLDTLRFVFRLLLVVAVDFG
jgi:hypothetical protein